MDQIDIITIADEEAHATYAHLAGLQTGKKGYIKKNWSDQETKLLKWAVVRYAKEKQMNPHSLVSYHIRLMIKDNVRLAEYFKTDSWEE